MAAKIVPRWEWRTFGDDFGAAEAQLGALGVERVEESDEVYLLSRHGDAAVKVRHGLLDVKGLVAADDGLEQWMPVAKSAFPVSRDDVGAALARLRVEPPPLDREAYTVEDLLEAVRPIDALLAVEVHKRRSHFRVGGCMADISEIRTDHGSTRSLAVESEDPARLLATVRSLGLATRANVCMTRGLKVLAARRGALRGDRRRHQLGQVARRRAGADGAWCARRRPRDRTRLARAATAAGALGPEPMARTLDAIAAMAGEARRAGAAAIAAVGTAGVRAAANAAEFVGAVEPRCDVRIETIPGEEEGRLAYLAAKSGLGLARGSLAVFDTGGGNSQFTFGDGDVVEEQFSVPLGAVRLTERHGLERAVSQETVRDTLDQIAADWRARLRQEQLQPCCDCNAPAWLCL